MFQWKGWQKVSNIDKAVEDRTQNANLAAIDNVIFPRIELAVSSKNASFEQDAASCLEFWERGERMEIAAAFENVSEKNNTLHEVNANDETRRNIPDDVGDLSVSRTHSDRQTRSHHRHIKNNQRNVS